jgi:uncharacterized protein YndB with AHSA1/START domain
MAELVRELLIDATPETVFEFLTVPEKHAEWMGTEVDLEPYPGGIYRLVVGGRHEARGEFVDVVPGERVAFTFGWDEPGHPIPAGSTRIDITLAAEGTKTRVRLVHSGLPADAVDDHTKGWDHYLDRLSQVSIGRTVGPDLLGDEPDGAGEGDASS